MLALAAILLSLTIMLDKTSFVTSQSRFFVNRMMSFGIGETAIRVVKQYPTLLDVNIFKKREIWYDTWYRDSGVTKWHQGFARQKGYNEWTRYMPCEPKSDSLYRLLHSLNLWSAAEPWVYFTWNPFYMLLFFPVCFLYRLFPLTAAFGYVVLSQVLILLLVLGPYNYNWRYYYFLFVSLYFLIPVFALDAQSLRRRFQVREKERMMDSLPKVSVIIPCYNQGAYVKESVDSVLAQTFQDFEILIVDDGSTDAETVGILKDNAWPKTRVIRTENQGLAAARNNGIQEARGVYILPLDADDRIGPDYLAGSSPNPGPASRDRHCLLRGGLLRGALRPLAPA